MSTRRAIVVLSILVSFASLAAACGDDDIASSGGDTPLEETAEPTSTEPAGEPLVELADSSLGDVLISNGFTLYLFTPDPPAETTCLDACAALWPPLEGDGAVDVGEGLDSSRFALISRPDGTMQVTFDDKPLYFYAPDTPGSADGQGIGDVWFVIDGDAEAVTAVASRNSGPGY